MGVYLLYIFSGAASYIIYLQPLLKSLTLSHIHLEKIELATRVLTAKEFERGSLSGGQE